MPALIITSRCNIHVQESVADATAKINTNPSPTFLNASVNFPRAPLGRRRAETTVYSGQVIAITDVEA